MDNFFEILIYLIIIFSFLSSLFKKKEQEKKPGSSLPVPEREKEMSTSSVESGMETKPAESYDILKEIENIFKENMGIPAPQPEEKNKTILQQKEEEKFDEAFSTNYDKQDARMFSAESRAIRSRDAVKKLDEKTLHEAEKFEELLKEHSILEKKKHPIVDKLKNPQSLKEYILISEILGKPVAYRR
ncbi:Hypothetical protein IALB_2255 [Ignavibacterium album JCM 16511]|uniref:Uncharacterized protein n=1 Tax=Ignavibacterium album (strain DSM 19864 / JCM 16511 / NBRC 101810 / Mat9-16) TaxID=945713 RepID=I0ALV1_IGNAJ|nr:hypothetical protein [Ignavibacterium album]AFH49958.1 Hypothetical protein IALB_2255 [Ignavibacterium album JCM 16511]